MRHDIDIEPLLSPWMERQARGAPDDLVPRVMKQVGSMSQQSTTWGAWLHPSSMAGWMTGGIAVVAMAIAIGVFIANLRGVPAGEQRSPSPVATPSSVAETTWERDLVGDAPGNAPDIVAVGITRSSDVITLDIELAAPMAMGSELRVALETNGAGPNPGPVPLEGPEECYGWFMEEFVTVYPSGRAQNSAGGGTWRPSPVLSGAHVSLDVPLQDLGVTDWLAFQVHTKGLDGGATDWFPGETDGCYPLIWARSSG